MENETLVNFGGEVKSLEGGKIGGYLVLFSTAADPDLKGDYFTKDTDFGFVEGMKSAVYFNHRMPLKTKDKKSYIAVRERIGEATLKMDDIGIFTETILFNRKEYEDGLVALGWSSGTAAHLVDREKKGNASFIKTWPLGLDASLTPRPCEPRAAVTSLKSYLEEDTGDTTKSDIEFEDETKAAWTAKYINALPDSAFAFIESGGTKDADGLTTPRSLRHFPYKDDTGALDEAHVKNALARIPQSKLSDADKTTALKVITAAAKKLKIEVAASTDTTKKSMAGVFDERLTEQYEAKGIFEEELAEQSPSFWQLTDILREVARDIASAASTSDITGVVIDVSAKVTEATMEYCQRLIPLITAQINDFVDKDDESYFYLKSYPTGTIFDSLMDVKGNPRTGLRMQEHSETVLTAAKELGSNATSTAKAAAALALRLEGKNDVDVKAGRVFSANNRERIKQHADAVFAAKDQMHAVGTGLMDLYDKTDPSPKEKPKSVGADEINQLVAQWAQHNILHLDTV